MLTKKIGFTVFSFESLVRCGKFLFPKYRFKWHQLDWWENACFNKFLVSFDSFNKFNDDRLWMLSQLSRLVRTVPGDTVECGVYRGASSYLICLENKAGGLNKVHHVFDSFEGLSEPSEADGDHWSKGDLACDLDRVKSNLSEFSLVQYYPGWIPERFSEVATLRFSLVHIDVDLGQPTLDSFSFFYERMEVGGIIICDDYGINTCPGATDAIDRYLLNKPEKMLANCSGGGFMIKGRDTGSSIFESESYC